MSKLSQKELLDEGFLDIVRQAAGRAAGAVGGAVVGAAKNIGKDFLTMNPNANLFASAGSGALAGAKAGVKIGGQLVTTMLDRLKKALKTEYANTFINKTIEYGEVKKLPGDENNNNRIAIDFTASRIKGVSRSIPPPQISTSSLSSSSAPTLSSSSAPTLSSSSTPNTSPQTPANSQLRGGQADAERYTAIFTQTKKGIIDKEYSLEIRDSANRIIRGTKETKEIKTPSWKELYNDEPEFQSGQPISVADLAAWIESNVSLRDRRVEVLMDVANNIPVSPPGINYTTNKKRINEIIGVILARTYGRGAGNSPQWDPDNLTPEQINTVKNFFVRQRIFTESHKKTQLQLLESSYNLIYELPINKGN